MAKLDLAYSTIASYRRVISAIWRPAIGTRRFGQVTYSMLVKVADAKRVGKKTYNNIVSVLRRAFEYGYRDHPERHNPSRGLKTLRMRKKDRPPVDPLSIEEAEMLVAAIHHDWGEPQGNYDEFRFFTGLRPSEEIALLVSDCDLERGTIAITKARVMAHDKDRTKTSEDRIVQLCPRALEVLRRQLALRERGHGSEHGSITSTCSSKTMASRSVAFTTAGSAGGTRSSDSACDYGRPTRRGTPLSRGVSRSARTRSGSRSSTATAPT
jgi:integrase